MATVTQALHRYLDFAILMNRRISIGGGMLVVMLIAETLVAILRPIA